MRKIEGAARITTADVLELNAIGDAIFSDWYPNHRLGEPVPTMPPLHIMLEAHELALRHRRSCRR